MGAAIADPYAEQKRRHRREAEAKRRYREERRQRERAASCRTACAFCGWSFEGSAEDGVRAASEHRREVHPELPTRSPNPRFMKKQQTRGAAREANRLAVLRAAEEIGQRAAPTHEIAKVAGVATQEAGRALVEAGFKRLSERPRTWWLDRSNPPPKGLSQVPTDRLEEALERLRDEGRIEVHMNEIAEVAGLSPVAVGKMMPRLGYARAAQVGARRYVWKIVRDPFARPRATD